MKEIINLKVNGKKQAVTTEADTPLLYLLRNNFKQNGPRFGCGLAQCGACMVLLDGRATPSCVLPVKAAEGKEITTLDGLASEDGKLHAVQQAFIDEQAAQCGYCLNGMVIAAVSLLNENPKPDDAAIRNHMHVNLCRCGIQHRVVKAIRRAADMV